MAAATEKAEIDKNGNAGVVLEKMVCLFMIFHSYPFLFYPSGT